MTEYLQPTDNAPAVQVAVVKPVLLDNVTFEPIEVFFGQ